MKRFIESICAYDGRYQLLDLHQRRINTTFARFFEGAPVLLLNQILPTPAYIGKTKVRIVYSHHAFEVSQAAYSPKPTHKLKLVEACPDYTFKYEDRSALLALYSQKENADDILITCNGQVTDTSYSNVCFWNGKAWHTPSSHLLNGVKRQYLIQQGAIQERNIHVSVLRNYHYACLINAMLDLGDVCIPMDHLT